MSNHRARITFPVAYDFNPRPVMEALRASTNFSKEALGILAPDAFGWPPPVPLKRCVISLRMAFRSRSSLSVLNALRGLWKSNAGSDVYSYVSQYWGDQIDLQKIIENQQAECY